MSKQAIKAIFCTILVIALCAACFFAGRNEGIKRRYDDVYAWANENWRVYRLENGEWAYILDETNEHDGTIYLYDDGEWYDIELFVP